ncbi:hypothetical protein B4Q04_22060 [Zobellia sp. OII3]|uniref:hypothetical protein n=1 Tax=Zobellia sp. OII3 TaxID=2034520 RepID=UPI000B53246A|nr:hypothetical protein [Zobellia sp. OII3]OWW23174.1 hypothetical protein B4Q04_22060 [Zobellia sp. OII3]
MKGKFYFLVLLIIMNFSFSCEKDDLEHKNEFEISRNVWLDFKESANNSYKYKAVGGSFNGSAWETTLTVSDGKLIERHFRYTSTEGLSENIPEENLEWTENDTEIGTHVFAGAEALTLNEVYEKAEKEWLIQRENSKTYFEAENNGLISTCGFVEDGCQDDCFVGITISSIEIL